MRPWSWNRMKALAGKEPSEPLSILPTFSQPKTTECGFHMTRVEAVADVRAQARRGMHFMCGAEVRVLRQLT